MTKATRNLLEQHFDTACAADSRFDIEFNDETDRYWQPEGITKTLLDRLHGCINTATGSPVRSEGYFSSDDRYILYFDFAKIRQELIDLSPQEKSKKPMSLNRSMQG